MAEKRQQQTKKQSPKAAPGQGDFLFELLTGMTHDDLNAATLAGLGYDMQDVPPAAWDPRIGMPQLGAFGELNLPSGHGVTFDLPQHALASQAITERFGPIAALLAGSGQEISTGLAEVAGGNPFFSTTGASTADLLANIIGIGRASPATSFLMNLLNPGSSDVEGALMQAIAALVQGDEKLIADTALPEFKNVQKKEKKK